MKINNVAKFIHFIPILRDNSPLYFSFLILNILLIYFITVIIIIMLFQIKKKKLNKLWIIVILKYSLPFYSITFFGQIFLLFITIFDCINGYAYVNEGIKCRTGLWFYFLGPMGIIALIFQIIIGIITNLLYFHPIFINKK